MMHRAIYRIPKMDCPAEEQLIRMTLDDAEGIHALEFDLLNRILTVRHSGDPAEITSRLVGLRLGATLSESTVESDTMSLPSQALASDRREAKVLWILLAINGVMFVAELVAGWLAESTGLIADSLDMLADATVYGIGLYAVGRASRHKLRAAHLSGWFQMLLALGALFEVVRRLVLGSDPEPPFMMAVAGIALMANVACLWLLAKQRDRGAHMKASWIFSTNDVIANLGVILAGGLVAATGSRYPDLMIGGLIAVVVFSGAVRILRLR